MKFVLALLFLAGLAFAEPESDASADAAADAYYGYYGLGYGYGGYYGGYYGYPRYYGYYGRKKREADPAVLATTHAAPAVVPHLGYGLGLGYAYGAPLLHGAVPHTYTVAHKDATVTPGKVEVTAKTAPLVYAAHPYAYGHLGYYGLPLLAAAPAAAEEPAAVEARKKREAEAEADPEAWYYGYYGHGYGGYYGLGYGRYYGGYYGYPGYGYAYYG